MSDLYRNPQLGPTKDRELEKRMNDHEDWGGSRMNPVGPAGKSTIINQDEKGILEDGLFEAMRVHQKAELGSTHDSHAMGIYSDTESKFAD